MKKLLVTTICLLGAHLLSAGEIWISPQGNDFNDGTRPSPKATLTSALRQAREWRRTDDERVRGGITICMEGGKVTGTSYAAAYAGGCVALLYSYQVNVKKTQMINHNDIKAQLIRGAVRSEYMVYPNPVSGYGKLNIYTTFNMMRIS